MIWRKRFTAESGVLFRAVTAAMCIGFASDAAAQKPREGAIDRTVLPVPEPKRPTLTELDVRKAKPPPRFDVKAPPGAPNVVIVLLDDMGFAHPSTFGGAMSPHDSRGEGPGGEREPGDGSEDRGGGRGLESAAHSIRGDRGFMMLLRNVTEEDLPIFFEHQRDAVALRMAAFSSRERDAFLTHWRTNVLRPENLARTIVAAGVVTGYIGSWDQDGRRLVGYWIGREHWGKGIATRALMEFLGVEPFRPLHAWVAVHNVGSIRVLEKGGFRLVSQQQHADGIAEVLMMLGP